MLQEVLLLRLLAEVLPVEVEDGCEGREVDDQPSSAVDDVDQEVVLAYPGANFEIREGHDIYSNGARHDN